LICWKNNQQLNTLFTPCLFSFPISCFTAIKLRDISFKNDAFSAVYENLASASQMIFCEAGCDAFVQ